MKRSGYAHFHLSCRYHSHTAAGLRSFCIAVSLSFSYSGRATLILHCRVAIILIQRSSYALLHCRVAIILTQRSGYVHFALQCRYHSHTAVGLRSFCIAVSLSLSYSGRATLILHWSCRSHFHWMSGFHLVCLGLQGVFQGLSGGRDVGHLSPRST